MDGFAFVWNRFVNDPNISIKTILGLTAWLIYHNSLRVGVLLIVRRYWGKGVRVSEKRRTCFYAIRK